MLPRLLFVSSVLAATLAVILLATLPRPSPTRNPRNAPRRLYLTLYLHVSPLPRHHHSQRHPVGPAEALVYRHVLTAGPALGSRPVGSARGFVVPTGSFARSPFNIVYFAIEDGGGGGPRGTVGVDARGLRNAAEEVLRVVGGTGDFAFARGKAVLRRIDGWDPAIAYRVEIRLRLPSDPSRHDNGYFNPP